MTTEISNTNITSLLEHFSARRDAMLTTIRKLVEVESPSGHEAGSHALVDLLAQTARETDGVTSIERIKTEGYGEHLLIRAFGDGDSNSGTLFLLGHTDTVHEVGSLKLRPWRVEGNRIFAPGIFDMKANCVLALEAINACSKLKLRPGRELVLLLTCDEEVGSESGRPLVEAHASHAALALVLEPPASGGRVKTGRKGTGIFSMEIEGRAAHAGLEPEKGASAILELAKQIEWLHSLNDSGNDISVNVGVVGGGTRSNVVAERASAEIDLRFSKVSEGNRVESEILRSRPFDQRTQVHVRGGINRPPLERTDEVLKLYKHARDIASLLGFDLGEAQVGGASDGNFVAALGVPVLDGLGIDGDGAHAAHEHIIVDDIDRRGALLAGLIATL
jgi:glutamate carboxypeptidase